MSAALFVVFGIVVLVAGGELLLRGAVSVARFMRLSPAVVGLTVVAAATSVPELAVSLAAALGGSSDIAVGNVVGSNIVNIGLILGLSAVITPLVIQGQTIKLEYPFLALVTYLLIVVVQDGSISRFEASFFVLLIVMFYAYMVSLVRQQMTNLEAKQMAEEVESVDGASQSPLWMFGYIVFGVALLWCGAELTVRGAIMGAQAFGISDRIIGLTVVAVGTSLPELVASVVSAVRGRGDIAVGNIVGSNIFNILAILGIAGLITPISVNSMIVSQDNWWMLGFALLLFPMMVSRLVISRLEGAVLVAGYIVYTTVLLRGQ